MIACALLHNRVINKREKETISSFVALDLHDIARSSRTYGLDRFYLIHPVLEQLELARQVSRHWVSGYGHEANPTRAAALHLVRYSCCLGGVLRDLREATGCLTLVVATSAGGHRREISFGNFRNRLQIRRERYNFLILFGTAWGLERRILAHCHFILAPIVGVGCYRHLSVRSAATVIMDRLFGQV